MMFKGKLKKGALALALMGTLAGCGGGGDSITVDPLTLGQLIASGAASGTFLASSQTFATVCQANNCVVQIYGQTATPFTLTFNYAENSGQVTSMTLSLNGVDYTCGGSSTYACPAANIKLDATARTITLTNLDLKSVASTTVTLRSLLQWLAPVV